MRSLALLLLALIRPAVVRGFSSGAGGCSGGEAAVGGFHLSADNGRPVVPGTLAEGAIRVTVGNIELDAGMTNVLPIEEDLLVQVLADDLAYLGVLVRLEAPDGVDTTMALTPGMSTASAAACAAPVVGITHTDNTEKTLATGTIRFDEEVLGATLDVTIVFINVAGGSAYVYDGFNVDFRSGDTTPAPVPVTPAPVAATAAPVTAAPVPAPVQVPVMAPVPLVIDPAPVPVTVPVDVPAPVAPIFGPLTPTPPSPPVVPTPPTGPIFAPSPPNFMPNVPAIPLPSPPSVPTPSIPVGATPYPTRDFGPKKGFRYYYGPQSSGKGGKMMKKKRKGMKMMKGKGYAYHYDDSSSDSGSYNHRRRGPRRGRNNGPFHHAHGHAH